MTAFNDQLYAGISDNQGYQVWRTDAQGKPPYKWTAVLVYGAYRGVASPTVTSMEVFNDKLYVGSATETIGPGGSRGKASELVAVNPDDSWNLIMGDARQTPEGSKTPLSHLGAGFGNRFSVYLWKLASHDGWLYAGTYDYSTFGSAVRQRVRRIAGFDLWMSHDGVHWQKVSTTGFGNPYNYGVRTMLDTPAGLFLGTANPFAAAPDHQGGAEIWLLPNPGGLTRPHGVALSPSACPMAHCGPHIDNTENISIPTNAVTPAWQVTQSDTGYNLALGCSAGTHIVVCSGTVPPSGKFSLSASYIRAFDLQGHALWDSRSLVTPFAAGGVPLLDDQDNVYVSDNRSLISFTAQGVVRWQVPNPGKNTVVSLNILQSGFLVGQAGIAPGSRNLLLVINPQTGAIASSLQLTDTVNGFPGTWGTPKTVAVVGNRVYTVTQFQPFSSNGSDPSHQERLYAIDVNASGQLHVAWYWSFEGPTNGSPLALPGTHTTIYFPGTGFKPGDPQHVMLFALQDMGTSAGLYGQST